MPGDTLPPVVAKLVADVDDFIRKMAEAEAAAKASLGETDRSTHSSTENMSKDMDHLADVWVDDTGRAHDAQGRFVKLSEQDWTELGRRAEDSSRDVRNSMQRMSSGADDVTTHLDRMASGARGPLQDMTRGVEDVASSVKKAAEDIVPSLDSIGGGASSNSAESKGAFEAIQSALSGLASYAMVAAVIILGPAALGGIVIGLGLVATAAMALPAAILGLITVMGTLKLAFDGVSAAIQDGWSGNADQLKKDLAKLTPAQRNFVAEVLKLKPAFEDLKTSVAQTFFSGMGPLIEGLAGLLKGPLKQGLDAVASGVNDVAARFLKWLETPQTQDQITQLLKNIGDIVSELGPGVTQVAAVILQLANDASPLFYTLVGLFNQLTGDWIRWLSETGDDTLGKDFRALGEVMKGLVPIVEQIGGMLLNTLADPGTQKAIKDMFKALQDVVTYLGPSMPYLINAFDNWMKAIDKLAPVIGGVVLALAFFASMIALIIQAIAWFVKEVVKAFAWLYDTLVGHSIIPDLVNGILGWFGKLGALPGKVLGWFRSMANAASKEASHLLGIVSGIPGQILGALGSLGGLLYSRGRQLVDGLVSGIQDAAGWLMSVASNLAAQVENAFSSVLKFGSPSKVFIQRGQQIVQGLVLGIRGQQHTATRAASGLAGMTAAGFGSPALAATAASIGASSTPAGGGGGLAAGQVINLTAQLDGRVIYQRLVTIAQQHKGRNVSTMFT